MNAKVASTKPTKSLSRKRQIAQLQAEDQESDLEKFTCASCERTYFDTGLFFYGVKSTRCLWCTKFPPTKKRQLG
jgi:hypothetical protein